MSHPIIPRFAIVVDGVEYSIFENNQGWATRIRDEDSDNNVEIRLFKNDYDAALAYYYRLVETA